jgi:hypothetical protein
MHCGDPACTKHSARRSDTGTRILSAVWEDDVVDAGDDTVPDAHPELDALSRWEDEQGMSVLR